jgi:hypothetical protein
MSSARYYWSGQQWILPAKPPNPPMLFGPWVGIGCRVLFLLVVVIAGIASMSGGGH